MLCITVGFFDGVHRGHRHLLAALKALGGDSLVLTFSNHPAGILGASSPRLITTLEKKLQLLEEEALRVSLLAFTPELAAQSYEQFLEPYPIRHLVLGEGAALGKGRLGTAERLRALGEKRGFEVHVVSHLYEGDAPITSSRIRALLVLGKKEEAERLLGRSL